MKPSEQEAIAKLLKESVPPIDPRADAEAGRDLWPGIMQRLATESTTVPWIDWALLGAVAVLLVLFPKTIPILFYYL